MELFNLTNDNSIIKSFTIPPKEYCALELKKGQTLRFTDVAGKQVVDVVFFNLNNLEEKLSCIITKVLNKTWKLTTGHFLYSQLCNPMLEIVDDSVGVHAFTGRYCSDDLNFFRYGLRGTRNCEDNLTKAVSPYGLKKEDLVEACCCFFMNLVYEPDGTCEICEPLSQQGDYVELLAKMDLIVAISNCPQDSNPCNAFNPTPMEVTVFST